MTTPRIRTTVRPRRERASLSQRDLAERLGISRQALIAIESGRQVPSTALALRLGGVLGCRVEELFQLAGPESVAVALVPPAKGLPWRARRVLLGRVDGRWVAHPLGDDAPAAADGVVLEGSGPLHRVEPLAELTALDGGVLVAGCAPLLGVLSQHAGRALGAGRTSWLPASSERALSMLRDGLVHLAGLHGVEGRPGAPAWVRRRLPGRHLQLVHLTCWRQGLVVAAGGRVASAADLLRPGVRLARREAGSGAESLLRRVLAAEGAAPGSLGPGLRAGGHAEVAELVRAGAADAGIAIESAALAAGLRFLPLSEERFDLVVPGELASSGPVARVLDLLQSGAFRREAARLPGYDASRAGQVTSLGSAA